MQFSLVMTVIGPDRPGLVESVASIVSENGGNWLESRMSRLGGQFAGILRVEYPSEKQETLLAALKQLEQRNLTISVHLDRAKTEPVVPKLSTLEIVGHDRPGIVREISRVLASHNVNVEELSSELGSAAMSGEMLFKAKAKLSVPGTCKVEALRKDLEKIASDLIVDIAFQA